MPYLKFLNNALLVLGIFAVLTVLFYGNTIANGFVHDDVGQIVRNEYIQSLQYIPKVVTSCIWESQMGDCFLYYRPIQTLSYLFTWQMSSSPAAFHVVNILYFFGVISLVFFVGRALTGSALFAFIASLIVLAHPVNSEVVNWISAVPELTFTLFTLTSLLFYIHFRKQPVSRVQGIGAFIVPLKALQKGKLSDTLSAFMRVPWPAWWAHYRNLLFAVLFYFFAMLAKEPAVLLPVLFIFLDAFVFRSGSTKRTRKKKHKKLAVLSAFYQIPTIPYIALIVPLLAYFAMRLAVLGALVQGSFYHGEFSFAERVYAFFTLSARYIEKLIFSYPPVFYYQFEKSVHFADPVFLVSLAVCVGFAGAIIYSIWRANTLLAFFFFWTIPFLLPVVLFLNSTGENIFSERYAFASSIGFAYAASSGLLYLFAKRGVLLRWTAPAILAVFLIAGVATILPRNQEFKDDFALYSASLEKNPNAHDLRRNLAVELTEIGRFDEAITQLEYILDTDPQWRDIAKVYSNLGDAYRGKSEYDRSDEYYRKALEITEGQDYRAYNNIGANFLEQGKQLESLLYFCRSVAIAPEAPEPNFNFNRASGFFDAVDAKGLGALFNDITKGGTFHASEFERIVFEDKTCQDDTCTLRFRFMFQSGEILLPFLILEKTSDDDIMRPTSRAFDGPNGKITLTIDAQNSDDLLYIIFPTCEGIYYEATAS
jgi:tetratricopeptide (TPR) repeat protein